MASADSSFFSTGPLSGPADGLDTMSPDAAASDRVSVADALRRRRTELIDKRRALIVSCGLPRKPCPTGARPLTDPAPILLGHTWTGACLRRRPRARLALGGPPSRAARRASGARMDTRVSVEHGGAHTPRAGAEACAARCPVRLFPFCARWSLACRRDLPSPRARASAPHQGWSCSLAARGRSRWLRPATARQASACGRHRLPASAIKRCAIPRRPRWRGSRGLDQAAARPCRQCACAALRLLGPWPLALRLGASTAARDSRWPAPPKGEARSAAPPPHTLPPSSLRPRPLRALIDPVALLRHFALGLPLACWAAGP